MKRVLSLLLTLCLMFCMVTPALALETDVPDATGQTVQAADSGTDTIGDSGEKSDPEAPPQEIPPDEPQETEPPTGESTTATEEPATEEITTEEIPETSGEEAPAPGVSLFSDFTGGDATFNTRVILTVTDRDGNPLEGAVYGLYASDGTFVAELVTGSDGTAASPDIPVDTDYYIEEHTPPEGFLPNEGRKEIKLTDVCAPSSIDVTAEYDPIMGQIKVIKTDPDGNPLAGAGFYVYDTDDYNNPVDDITTGEDGTVVTKPLSYGEYELYEYTAPEGFSAGGYCGYYYITQPDEILEATITNYRESGNLKITKTGNDGRKIQGAVFGIYKADTDEWVQDATTGSSGYVYVYSLLLGDYYAVEKSVPAPYELDETRRDFSLTYDGEYTYLDVTNNVAGEPGKVKIIKTDDSGNPLSGVVFGLYRTWDGAKLDTLTGGGDGTAESSPLIPGDYYLVEEIGKEGYTPTTGQIPFTIDGSGVTVEMPVVNSKIRIFGKVKVIKTDDAGRYFLAELVSPAGYQLDTQRHSFTVKGGECVTVTVTDEPIQDDPCTPPPPVPEVTIPKTGEPFPAMQYGLAALCVIVAALSGAAYCHQKKHKKYDD